MKSIKKSSTQWSRYIYMNCSSSKSASDKFLMLPQKKTLTILNLLSIIRRLVDAPNINQ